MWFAEKWHALDKQPERLPVNTGNHAEAHQWVAQKCLRCAYII